MLLLLAACKVRANWPTPPSVSYPAAFSTPPPRHRHWHNGRPTVNNVRPSCPTNSPASGRSAAAPSCAAAAAVASCAAVPSGRAGTSPGRTTAARPRAADTLGTSPNSKADLATISPASTLHNTIFSFRSQAARSSSRFNTHSFPDNSIPCPSPTYPSSPNCRTMPICPLCNLLGALRHTCN